MSEINQRLARLEEKSAQFEENLNNFVSSLALYDKKRLEKNDKILINRMKSLFSRFKTK